MNSYIYEVELNGIPLSDFTTIDGVYVGSTTKTPKERFQEHKRGGRFSNKFVKKYGSSMKSFSVNAVSRKDLNKQEQSYAETLRHNGKNVLSGKDAFYNAPIKCPQCSSSLYIMEIEHNGHIAFRCNSRACMYRNDDPMSVTNLIKGDYQNVFDYRERIEFEDGTFFYGVLNRDGISASGERIYKNGDSYKGQFKRGIREDQSTCYLSLDQGTYTWADGHKYVGEFKDGSQHGKGTWTHPDGRKYVGEYKDGKQHGKGTFTWADGSKHEGEWKDGKRHGKGTWTHPDGTKYVVEHKDGKENGKGTWTHPNGAKYVVEHKDGKRQGKGTFTLADGSKYVGEFEDDAELEVEYKETIGESTGQKALYVVYVYLLCLLIFSIF